MKVVEKKSVSHGCCDLLSMYINCFMNRDHSNYPCSILPLTSCHCIIISAPGDGRTFCDRWKALSLSSRMEGIVFHRLAVNIAGFRQFNCPSCGFRHSKLMSLRPLVLWEVCPVLCYPLFSFVCITTSADALTSYVPPDVIILGFPNPYVGQTLSRTRVERRGICSPRI